MAYCAHCGKPVEAGRFCTACGAPVAPDTIASAAAEMRRYRWELRLVAVALAMILAASTVSLVRSWRRAEPPGPVSTSLQPSQTPAMPPASDRTLPSPAAAADTFPPPPQQEQQEPPSPPAQSQPQLPISPQAQARQQEPPQTQPRSSEPDEVAGGTDQYPGSQPVNTENVSLPDIGIPVATETYSTNDSRSTVIAYYRHRYPDATVSEVNGQTVIAVNREGAARVIAIGSSDSDTRIAIVRQKNQ
jgi:hypothetical protein